MTRRLDGAPPLLIYRIVVAIRSLLVRLMDGYLDRLNGEEGQTLRTVVEAGGTVVVPKTEIPLVGWFAMFLDPDQIPIGILQPKKAGAS